MKIAVITGASSGIGAEFAKQIDRLEGLDEIWLVARRKDPMETMSQTLKHPVKIFPADLTKPRELQPFYKALVRSKAQIKILVNSAGSGKIGYFENLPLEDHLDVINLNCKALVGFTYLCLPFVEQGTIYQLASVAAFIPQPNFSIYAASKAFVLSFSRALNQELKEKGNRVIAVCPNPVETEFFKNAGNDCQASAIKKIGVEKVERVVAVALNKLKTGRDISLSGFWSKVIYLASRCIPHRIILPIEKRILSTNSCPVGEKPALE